MHKGLKSLEIRFSEPHLTHYGGMVLIHRFCNRLGLRRMIQRQVSSFEHVGDYDPATLLLVFLYAIIMGLKRVHKTEILQYNGAFLKLLGLHRFPDRSTLRRFLKRLQPQSIRQIVTLHDRLRHLLFRSPGSRTSLVFDLDSVVLVVYGRKQGAQVGYNPKKPGRRSYHPLLAFEARHQEFWHGSLRPGKAASATGAVPFIKRCLAKVPKDIARSRIRFRADSGFCSRRIVEFLDAERVGYVIVARLYPPIKKLACGGRFEKLENGWEVGTFQFQPPHWLKPHRYVVVRRPIPEDPIEAKQLNLFQHGNYVYHVSVSNLALHPWRIWRFYSGRAIIEKNIRELIYDYPLGDIPTQDWIPNVAFFHILLLAYDIVHWFKRLCLPREYLHLTLDTIRSMFLAIPARLTKQGSRNVLCLPKDYPHQGQFRAAFSKAGRWRVPK